MDRYWYKDS